MADEPSPPFSSPRPGNPWWIGLIGSLLVVAVLLLLYLVYEAWPAVVHATGQDDERQTITLFDGTVQFKPTPESVLILLVILTGALGAALHAIWALVGWVAKRRFASSFYWWYASRIPVGAGLAVLVYFTLRGGIIGDDTNADDVNPYGIAAIAALTGFFSRAAIEKLNEVFETFFRTREEDVAGDAGLAPLPRLESVAPASFAAAQGQALTVTGAGFTKDSTVMIAAVDPAGATLLQRPNLPVSETEMTVGIAAAELPAGNYQVRVANPPPGGGISDAQPLVAT